MAVALAAALAAATGVNGSSFQGYATRADINEGFALNNLQGGQRDILGAVTNGFHGVDSAICNLGYQLQDCCCQTQRAVDGVNYNLATQANGIQSAIQGVRYDMATQACDTRNTIHNSTRDIIDNQNANSRAILDFLTQDKIATLQAENQSLKLAGVPVQPERRSDGRHGRQQGGDPAPDRCGVPHSRLCGATPSACDLPQLLQPLQQRLRLLTTP